MTKLKGTTTTPTTIKTIVKVVNCDVGAAAVLSLLPDSYKNLVILICYISEVL